MSVMLHPGMTFGGLLRALSGRDYAPSAARLRFTIVCLASMCVALACGVNATAARAAAYWVPPQHLTWYWQLTGTPNVEPVQATDIDGFDNSAATVAGFHALGQRTICYIDVGTWESARPDAGGFPPG
jgi:Glycoside-hydrolase family GH114